MNFVVNSCVWHPGQSLIDDNFTVVNLVKINNIVLFETIPEPVPIPLDGIQPYT